MFHDAATAKCGSERGVHTWPVVSSLRRMDVCWCMMRHDAATAKHVYANCRCPDATRGQDQAKKSVRSAALLHSCGHPHGDQSVWRQMPSHNRPGLAGRSGRHHRYLLFISEDLGSNPSGGTFPLFRWKGWCGREQFSLRVAAMWPFANLSDVGELPRRVPLKKDAVHIPHNIPAGLACKLTRHRAVHAQGIISRPTCTRLP